MIWYDMILAYDDMIYQSTKWYDMISVEYHTIYTIASVAADG